MNQKRSLCSSVALFALGALSVGVACAPPSVMSGNDVPSRDAIVAQGDMPAAPHDVPQPSDMTVVEDTGSGDDARVPPGLTWWGTIKPLFEQTCTTCHSPTGIAPMPLESLEQVRPFARLIASQTTNRIMPPWMPREGCRDINNSRALTDAEIAQISQWVTAGMPEGNMAEYQAPGPRAGTVRPLPARDGDIVVRPAAAYLPNQRTTDDYHCFVMDPALTESRDVIGVRVTAGNARIVHHVILFEVRTGGLAQLQRLDDAEPGPGYTCFGSSGVDPNFRAGTGGDLVDTDVQMVTGWAPGGVAGYLPVGTGIRLKPGSRLVMQVHYNMQMSTRNMNDQSKVELFLGEPGTTQQAFWLPQANQDFLIPANVGPMDPRARVTTSFRAMQLPVRIFGVAPHMHVRGSSIHVDITTGAGVNNCMVDIPRWDFHWQQAFFFRTPYRLGVGANGDTLRTTCVFDNRPENQPFVDGVQVQSRDLRWGENTTDEMCLNFYYVSI
jgi:hypothetical protein